MDRFSIKRFLHLIRCGYMGNRNMLVGLMLVCYLMPIAIPALLMLQVLSGDSPAACFDHAIGCVAGAWTGICFVACVKWSGVIDNKNSRRDLILLPASGKEKGLALVVANVVALPFMAFIMFRLGILTFRRCVYMIDSRFYELMTQTAGQAKTGDISVGLDSLAGIALIGLIFSSLAFSTLLFRKWKRVGIVVTMVLAALIVAGLFYLQVKDGGKTILSDNAMLAIVAIPMALLCLYLTYRIIIRVDVVEHGIIRKI